MIVWNVQLHISKRATIYLLQQTSAIWKYNLMPAKSQNITPFIVTKYTFLIWLNIGHLQPMKKCFKVTIACSVKALIASLHRSKKKCGTQIHRTAYLWRGRQVNLKCKPLLKYAICRKRNQIRPTKNKRVTDISTIENEEPCRLCDVTRS